MRLSPAQQGSERGRPLAVEVARRPITAHTKDPVDEDVISDDAYFFFTLRWLRQRGPFLQEV